MENSELPREEALVRLYELTAQLELYDAERWLNAEPVVDGDCLDCGRTRPRRRLGVVKVCESCGLSRIRVAALLDAQRARHA